MRILEASRFRVGVLMVIAACGGSAAGLVPEATEDCEESFGDPSTSAYLLPWRVGRTYEVIQSYCPSNPDWGHHGWYAYDFDLATGDTVLASRAGRVRFIREDQPDIGRRCGVGGENMAVIQHDDGSVMHYVHFTTDGVLVDVGDRVEQGQPIALSGNSGCSSGPHLHVVLFPDATDYGRTASEPFNYRNADGPLDGNDGLVQGAEYTAVEAAPPGPASGRDPI